MATRKKRSKKAKDAGNGGANLGFEGTLWQAADKLRGHMDAAECKHVALGLLGRVHEHFRAVMGPVREDVENRSTTEI